MPEAPTLRALSLGGGVQSSAMLMMGAQGRFGPPPDLAIFADTGNEPQDVYEMVGWLDEHSGIEVVTVRGEVPIAEAVSNGTDAKGCVTGFGVPFHTLDVRTGKLGMARRICTSNWKVVPIEQELRRRLGVSRITRRSGIRVEQWLGITTDEIERVSPSQTSWVDTRWPLIEVGMSRTDCEKWWAENASAGAPPLARSACAICPYRTASEWLDLQDSYPELFDTAAEVEASYNARQRERGYGHIESYLHRRRIPLKEAVAADRDLRDSQGRLFERAGECSGSCWT